MKKKKKKKSYLDVAAGDFSERTRLNKNDEDDDETTHGDQRRREERRAGRGLTDAKEDKNDFVVTCARNQTKTRSIERGIERRRAVVVKSASSSEKRKRCLRGDAATPPLPTPRMGRRRPSSSSREKEKEKIDAEHKLPPELKTFNKKVLRQIRLIWTRMEKHVHVYSSAFAERL